MPANPNKTNYVREAANLFVARCSNAATLGPNDFATIAEWEKQEIPLDVILKSIGEACNDNGEAAPVAICDFQEKVRRDFIHWLQKSDPNDR